MNIKFGIAEILTLIFIILKLCGKITWSWLWVFSPMWIAISIIVFMFTLLGFFTYLKNKS